MPTYLVRTIDEHDLVGIFVAPNFFALALLPSQGYCHRPQVYTAQPAYPERRRKMTEPTPLNDLEKLREAIVTRRRDEARSIIEQEQQRTALTDEKRCVEIASTQNIIECLDRAIADEKKLGPTKVTAFIA
jgi:hypothetical protein